MAEIRWRRHQLLTAEAAIQATRIVESRIGRERRLLNEGKGTREWGDNHALEEWGLSATPESRLKYSRVLELLRDLRAMAESEDLQDSGLEILQTVYGEDPGQVGAALENLYESCQEEDDTEDAATQPENRRLFLEKLDEEIRCFSRLAELHEASEVQLAESMQDALLLPDREDLDLILRYETAVERQFERKLQQLVAWRSEKAERGLLASAQVQRVTSEGTGRGLGTEQ